MPETQADRLREQMAQKRASAEHGDRVTPLLEAFEALECTYARLHEALLSRRQAVRHADVNALKASTERERSLITDLVTQNAARAASAQRLARDLGLKEHGNTPIPLGAILNRVSSEERDALDLVASRLRDRIEDVRNESAVLKHVSESLLTHVRSLAQRLHLAVSRVAVYGRDGRVGNGGATALVTGVDLRT